MRILIAASPKRKYIIWAVVYRVYRRYASAEDLGVLKCDFDVKLSNPPGHVPGAHVHRRRPTVGKGGVGGDAAVIVTLISPGDPSNK